VKRAREFEISVFSTTMYNERWVRHHCTISGTSIHPGTCQLRVLGFRCFFSNCNAGAELHQVHSALCVRHPQPGCLGAAGPNDVVLNAGSSLNCPQKNSKPKPNPSENREQAPTMFGFEPALSFTVDVVQERIKVLQNPRICACFGFLSDANYGRLAFLDVDKQELVSFT
jgi:hypothetical protein